MSYVNRVEDVPIGEHWAILRSSGVYVPADERSKTAPGHGYPAHTEPYMSYQAFSTYDEFRTEFLKVLNSPYGDKKARGIHVTGTYSGRTEPVLEEEVS